MPEQLSSILEGLIETEKNYKSTLQDSHEVTRSLRRIRFMEHMKLLSNGSIAVLDEHDEASLKLDIDHIGSRDDWTANEVSELIHRYQNIHPTP